MLCTNLKCLPTDSSETVGQKVPKRRGGKCVVIIASCESLYSYISCPCFRCDRCVYHCLSVNYCCPLNCSSAQGRASIPAQRSAAQLVPTEKRGNQLVLSSFHFSHVLRDSLDVYMYVQKICALCFMSC